MEAAATGEKVQSGDPGMNAVGDGLLCRRNALPNVLDETVTKMPAGSAVSALARLHSIHGTHINASVFCVVNSIRLSVMENRGDVEI